MPIPEISLDGQPFNNVENFTWGLSEGVLPMTGSILFPNAQAQQILESARAKARTSNPYLQLKMKGQNDSSQSKEIVYNNVLVIGYGPSNYEPLRFTRIFIADSRWYWDFGHFKANFNMRTHVGDLDSVDHAKYPILGEIARTTFLKASYRTYSLNPPVRQKSGDLEQRVWKISEIIAELFIGSGQTSGPQSLQSQLSPLSILIDTSGLTETDDQLFEQVELDYSHKACLSHLLDKIPYIGVYTDYNGTVKFFNKSKGGEEEILAQVGSPMAFGSIPKLITNELMRASRLIFIFDTQCEIRFDYEDNQGDTTSAPNFESRTLTNVMRNPVPNLPNVAVPGGGIITALQDQILPFDSVLNAINANYNDINLTHSILMRDYVYEGLLFRLKYAADAKHSTGPWDKILGELKNSFRRMFRINGNWQSKMVNILDRRVSIFDPVTGQTAPSPIYQDYAYWLSTKGVLSNWNTYGKNVQVLQNVITWDTVGNSGYNLSLATPVPFGKVSMVDAENGIFTLELKVFDPSGFIKKDVFPSKIENPPVFDFLASGEVMLASEPSSTNKIARLSSTHRMATILSATPAPNTSTAYYTITKTPNDVSKDLVLLSRIQNSLGPPKYIKVTGKNYVARVKWNGNPGSKTGEEKHAELVEKLFGIGNVQPEFPNELKDQVTNSTQLDIFATKYASEYYARKIDRYEGSVSSEYAKLELNGSVESIKHSIKNDGTPYVTVKLADELKVPNFENLLDPSTKAFLEGQIQAGT